jgi:predicted MFS family arabinose efflux permease
MFETLLDMTGGTVCFYIGCYSYIADITDAKSRTTRLALMDGLFPLGFYVGNALSGYIKNNLGFMYNFSLGMLFSMLAMGYTLIFVKDSKELR